MFMLSAFYRPHNEYCVAVSGSADWDLKISIAEAAKCFSNINVMKPKKIKKGYSTTVYHNYSLSRLTEYRPSIEWGSFEVINSTWACVELLAKTETKWMYYQQLSGVDVPLKTNLEMVKILKSLNNTVNSEVATFQNDRILSKQVGCHLGNQT
ncbi:Core-2/I-Branching enzyme [Oesophagostomum dentatum]|uniref:Core-2/I-Branching enzyme n=1 Tax=Oesophagostomum dentatum TaxID=61180 RepID=A0A0B1TSF2_OESDE|nr:Core-2/I-Branching enzyme [Oesophagostomum dentatum]